MHPLGMLFHDPRLRRRWRALLLALMAFVSWFAFVPHPPGIELPQGDKLQHLLAFAALAVAAALSLAPGLAQLVLCGAALLVYGAFIEVVQMGLPGRHGDWADLVFDALGIAAGLWLVAWLRQRWPAPLGS